MNQITQRYEPDVSLDALTPYPANPNRGATAAIEESLDASGWYGAVLAQEGTGTIIAGHHRIEAAKAKGGTSVPVLWLSVDDDGLKRILLADNRTARLGEDDPQALADLLGELAATDTGLIGTGFDAGELDLLLASLAPEPAALTDPDDVPEPPAEPVTKPGDLWLLGPHRVLCGDATKAVDYDRVLGGERAALCLTDPPYGVGIDYGSGVSDDEASVGALIAEFVPLIVTHAERSLVTTGRTMIWLYPRPSWVLGWVEPSGVGRGPWGFCCWQPVLAYGTDPYLAGGLGCRPDTYVGKGEGPSSDQHPVAKPITVWSWLMERGSVNTGDLILDPFGGSGTTVIAAHMLSRRAACIELSPAYVDVICRRFQAFTGDKPILEATGEPHDFANA